MRRGALFLIPALFLACSEQPVAPGDGLSGTYDFSFQIVLLTDPTEVLPDSLWYGEPGDANAFDPLSVELSCQGDGDASLAASGSAFGGVFQQTGTCEKPDGTVASAGGGTIDNGLVDGSRVQFEIRPCVFDGDLYRGAGGGAAGTVTCVVDHPRIRLNYRGDWSLTRGAGGGGPGS